MSEIEIEYCVPCGLLPRAEEVEHALLSRLGRRIDALRMKPGHGGVFRVSVGEDAIFDKSRDGYDVDEIVRRAEERVGARAEPPRASQPRR
jgi:selenoprotein W-related protein